MGGGCVRWKHVKCCNFIFQTVGIDRDRLAQASQDISPRYSTMIGCVSQSQALMKSRAKTGCVLKVSHEYDGMSVGSRHIFGLGFRWRLWQYCRLSH